VIRMMVSLRCVGVAVQGRRCTAFTVYPAGIAIDVVFFFPDRNAVFDFINDVTTRREGLATVWSADAYPNRHLTEFE